MKTTYSWDCDGKIDKGIEAILTNDGCCGVQIVRIPTKKEKRRKKMKRACKVLLITLTVALLVLGASQALMWIEDILAVYFGAIAPMIFIGLLVVAVGVDIGIRLTKDKQGDDNSNK